MREGAKEQRGLKKEGSKEGWMIEMRIRWNEKDCVRIIRKERRRKKKKEEEIRRNKKKKKERRE